jgi:hypothetical protein
MDGKLFQLIKDGENVGLVHINNPKISDDIVETLWEDFQKIEDDDVDNENADDFVEYANHTPVIDRSGCFFERVYLTECTA